MKLKMNKQDNLPKSVSNMNSKKIISQSLRDTQFQLINSLTNIMIIVNKTRDK